MAVVELLVELLAGHVDALGVDDDDEVARVDMGGVLGLPLPAERVGDPRGETSERLPVGVDDVPAASNLTRLRVPGLLHFRGSAFQWYCMLTKKRRTDVRRGDML